MTPDERKADAEFQKKFLKLCDESSLQVAFLRLGTETEKIEVIRILYDLLSEFGLRRRKSSVEIRNSLALPVEEIAFNLVNEMFRLQPFSMVCCAYQMRSAKFFSLSKIVQLWNHGNCAATCCTKSSSGQASAKALIYLRFRGEKPLISGNALRRSAASRSITLLPQPD